MNWLTTRIFSTVAASAFALTTSGFGQSEVGTPPSAVAPAQPGTDFGTETAPAPLNPTGDSNLHESPGLPDQVSAEERRFQYALKISMRGVYDDNINISQTQRVSDYFYTIEPVLTLGAGDISGQEDNFIRLDYAPSLFLFVHHTANNAVQQVIHLGGQHRFSRLTLTLAADVAILDGTDLQNLNNINQPGSQANLDVSGRTKFETYSIRAGASYDLSGKTFLTTEFGSVITDYNSSSLFSSTILSENIFLNYRYSDKLVFGLGGTGGYDLVDDPNPKQTFEQANARLTYIVTGKLSLSATGGVEFRQFEHDSRGQYVAPVFSLTATYQPTDATTLTLTGGRQTLNSGVLAGQDFANTNLQAALRQRFLQRFYVGVAGGFQASNYFSTVSGVSANRDDKYYFIEPSLDFSITRFWTIGGYYLHRQNDSSVSFFSFYDNQVGVRTALTF